MICFSDSYQKTLIKLPCLKVSKILLNGVIELVKGETRTQMNVKGLKCQTIVKGIIRWYKGIALPIT